jgi:1,4-alpha-glucan branching enzyme
MPTDGTAIVKLDPWLEPFQGAIKHRFAQFNQLKEQIKQSEGGYEAFSRGYEERGFVVDAENGVWYREWAPGVVGARLIGEFSERDERSERTLFLPSGARIPSIERSEKKALQALLRAKREHLLLSVARRQPERGPPSAS